MDQYRAIGQLPTNLTQLKQVLKVMSSTADGKPVVIVNGKRHGAVHETKSSAEDEAKKLNSLQESDGKDVKESAVVKTNLLG